MADEYEYDTCQQLQAPKPHKPTWTIMIYMAGDNNLSANTIDIMKDLEDADYSDDVRVLACFDSNAPRPKGARYLEINHRRRKPDCQKPIRCWGLHNDLVPPDNQGYHAVVSPDFCECHPSPIKYPDEPIPKEGLSRFLKYALKYHEAHGYMLILFGHGIAVGGNTFLIDNNPPGFLRLKEFAEVITRHFGPGKKNLDILACDNCMMNGIEAAYELRDSVDYMLGSQGAMLAVGWPFRKIISEIVGLKTKSISYVLRKTLRVCARNLLDFTLMDRSLEQATLNLKKFRKRPNIATAIKRLSASLQEGLEHDDHGELLYPAVCDAVRLARLEAQSYFDERFVDLYDFCELLLRRCDAVMAEAVKMLSDDGVWMRLSDLLEKRAAAGAQDREQSIKMALAPTDLMKKCQTIAERCKAVMREIKRVVRPQQGGERTLVGEFVLESYYIGSELQYSHGVSIYFPWTMPNDTIIFDPVERPPGGGYGGSPAYNTRWPDRPSDYYLKTPFDEYKTYDFAQCHGGDWAAFLESFFRATLRRVRRVDYYYPEDKEGVGFFETNKYIPSRFDSGSVDLHKTSTDTDSESDCSCPTIKNYPRRFYLAPADCLERCDIPGFYPGSGEYSLKRQEDPQGDPLLPCVSYLGWNIRGLLAKTVGLPEWKRRGAAGGADGGAQTKSEDETRKGE